VSAEGDLVSHNSLLIHGLGIPSGEVSSCRGVGMGDSFSPFGIAQLLMLRGHLSSEVFDLNFKYFNKFISDLTIWTVGDELESCCPI